MASPIRFDVAAVKRQQNLLSLVPNLHKIASTRGGEYAGPCPFCGGADRFHAQPNLPEGGLWMCRNPECGGGQWQDVIAFIQRRDGCTFAEAVKRLGAQPATTPIPPREKPMKDPAPGRIVATYDYQDESGAALFQVVRYEPKTFRQRRPDGRGGWLWGLGDVRRVLYHLPALANSAPADPVWLVEGEKDADALTALGELATTNPHGARSWHADYTAALAGRRVIFVPDRDPEGEAHEQRVVAALGPVAAALRVVHLPEGKDVSDWLGAGRTLPELIALAKEAPDLAARPAVAPPATPPPSDRAPQPLADGFPPGDVGNAGRFMHYFGQDVRYTLEWGWLVWDGRRWARDTTGLVRLKAHALRDQVIRHALAVEDRKAGDELLTLAKKLGQTATINNLLTEAGPMAGARTLDFDTDPWLFNCENGTLNLKTGALQPHNRADMISKLAPVRWEPDAPCPLWRLFIYRIFNGHTDVIGFMQRALGYSMTGSTKEQACFVMYGTGSNGKSTLWGTVSYLLGDYAMNTPVKTLLRKDRDTSINNDVARMVGARFVTASEPDMGKHLDIGLVKDLTGDDPVTARFLNKEYFTFDPVLKLWLATNHKPVIRDTTNAIWRRLHLIPFDVVFTDADKDPDMPEKLRTEGPGILRWLVEGCLAWQDRGLAAPDTIRAASEMYRQEMDPLGPFLSEYCDVGRPSYTVFHKSLYTAYVNWCDESGEKPVSRRALTDMLVERGYRAEDGTGNLKTWHGLQLRSTLATPE